MTVSERFNQFLANIRLTDDQKEDGTTKHKGVRKCLNLHYYGSSSEYNNSMLVGSWGKSTRVRPPRDVDVLLELPSSVYDRYQSKSGNKQSQLLQEVKGVLAATYTNTKMRADGQVVIVPFTTYAVEVLPAFKQHNSRYLICDTNGGGKYKEVDPVAEAAALSTSDSTCNGNTRNLIRMMKTWQEYCSVPMKSFWIELLAAEFLFSWEYKANSSVYYDYMCRDFFKYLINQKVNGYLLVAGTYEIVWLGDAWKSKAESARDRAIKACDYEADTASTTKNVDAWWEWKNIFGDDMPLN